MTAVWSNHVAHADGVERVRRLEDIAIHVIREAWGQFERPALELGEGPASLVLLHLAEKAFWPARVPFDLIGAGAPSGAFDAVVSAPQGEWDHRVTTGIFAVRRQADAVGDQRRDLWDLYNGRRRVGEQVRIVPLSNWTTQDVHAYLESEGMTVDTALFAPESVAS